MRGYYPVFFDLTELLAVVAGDGPEIAARAEALLDARARVRVVTPRASARVRDLAADERIELRERSFRADDLEGAALAIAAGDDAITVAVRDAATAARVPLSVVDRPQLCDWIHGAVLRRGALVAAISTSGAAPALGVRLRDRLAADLGPEIARFLEIAAGQRPAIAASGLDFAARRRLWYRVIDPALAALREGDDARVHAIFAAELAGALAAARGAA